MTHLMLPQLLTRHLIPTAKVCQARRICRRVSFLYSQSLSRLIGGVVLSLPLLWSLFSFLRSLFSVLHSPLSAWASHFSQFSRFCDFCELVALNQHFVILTANTWPRHTPCFLPSFLANPGPSPVKVRPSKKFAYSAKSD